MEAHVEVSEGQAVATRSARAAGGAELAHGVGLLLIMLGLRRVRMLDAALIVGGGVLCRLPAGRARAGRRPHKGAGERPEAAIVEEHSLDPTPPKQRGDEASWESFPASDPPSAW